MSQEVDGQKVDARKRKFLIAATSAVGGVAVAGVAVPLVMSMLPSARAKAAGAPVEVDISKVEPGMLLTVEWRGKPVWIVNRTPEMLDMMAKHDDQLADPMSDMPQQPDYCKNANRSIKPEYLVAVGICTHLGCSPTFRKDVGAADLGGDWPGGFFCPCHGSRFDLAARVFKGVPAPTNLVIPPHQYLSDAKLLIGVDAKGA
ncbi:MAG: ubiquinol-cytochrome c reductase iron-sulfur subunit [Gammaproteobacteria bacterium]|jgi:ubiquinol-cytochrome c reductase iron-sulfur subunit|nr:ubiquinol-cytochrome c reductase iron-sulfur subunit [Gammaproteobacteria bacterium]MBU1407304.1 ubiquinol-cytochrome c reductase iron-sulfur subunit [Gammaproteobacteria bacterium]MBU1531417.1 ubiquinol-cytochrome c reductase iron-sulfur subunit [Gammaproteobacteria bacterium]